MLWKGQGKWKIGFEFLLPLSQKSVNLLSHFVYSEAFDYRKMV